jgi:RNA polymerase sigma-70 factor (ECF subfamily)
VKLPRDVEDAMIARAKDDPEGFGALYDHYFTQIYRYVASRVRSQELAEDITSEVFFKALRAIGRYRPSGHPFSAWLYQIASNAITDHYRSRQRTEDSLEGGRELAAGGAPVDEEVAQRMGLAQIWEAIESLPDQQRAAMTLKYSEDLPLAEIGQILGKSEGAIKLLIFRGTATVRTELLRLRVKAEAGAQDG